MVNLALFATTVVAWGFSWLAIKLHLGVVAPEASLAYRFVIAAVVLIAFCAATGRSLRFGARAHARIALQAAFIFSTNFYVVYLGSQHLTSGLVALLFSTMVLMNTFGSRIVTGVPISPRVLVGALLGVGGIGAIFWPEIAAFAALPHGLLGLVLVLGGTVIASVGTQISAANQRRGLPVVETTAVGFVYGALISTGFALAAGAEFAFDPSPLYVGSLLYLALIASVVAFASFLTLIGRIGPARAAYATVLFPVVALAASTAVEGYHWTAPAVAGVGLVLAGNVLVLAKRRPDQAVEPARAA